MLKTYKATLDGDRLQWQREDSHSPLPLLSHPVEVLVTILDSPMVAEARDRGRRMRAALQKLSTSDALVDIADHAQWERDLRQDRALPGR